MKKLIPLPLLFISSLAVADCNVLHRFETLEKSIVPAQKTFELKINDLKSKLARSVNLTDDKFSELTRDEVRYTRSLSEKNRRLFLSKSQKLSIEIDKVLDQVRFVQANVQKDFVNIIMDGQSCGIEEKVMTKLNDQSQNYMDSFESFKNGFTEIKTVYMALDEIITDKELSGMTGSDDLSFIIQDNNYQSKKNKARK